MSESLSLYRQEDDLVALVESGEAGIAPELEQQYRQDLAQALERTIEKRDRVGQFIRHLESQAEFAGQESRRLAERKHLFERAAERMRAYVQWTLETIGKRKIEGKTVTFSLRKLPDVLQVDDEAAIPAEYKTLIIEIPAAAWERHIAQCADTTILSDVIRTEVKLDRRGLLAALKAGETVPGGSLRPLDYSLQMR